MTSLQSRIQRHLRPLVGLNLSIARRAGDMRVLHFGKERSIEGGSVGEFALHIQCPWRIEGPRGMVTGRSDLWEPSRETRAKPDFDQTGWTYEEGNLQDERFARLLGGFDSTTGSHVTRSRRLRVLAVSADRMGGAAISLSGGYRLVLWPAGSSGESWRIFRPVGPHFVIEKPARS